METKKKRCKRGGKSMKNHLVVKKDRISELPGALILQILSLLPTKSAIATSVLSKQWQFHWSMLPKLSFDSCNHKCWTFSKNVCKSLLSHKAPVLESLHLSFIPYSCEDIDIETWIEIADARQVRNLVLDVECKSFYYSFPKSLYYCESLETLILKIVVYVNVPYEVCLNSLRTLHLHSAFFRDESSFVHFLSGCPNLENLLLDLRGYSSEVKTHSTISVPSLQRLSIYSIYGGKKGCGYVIDAPSLKYLKIEGERGLIFRLTENVTNLVEADIIDVDVSHTIIENLLGPLTSVTRLSLELLPLLEIKFPRRIIFYQLVYLEIYTSHEAWWDFCFFMLDSSPILQVLKLINSEKRGGWRKGFIADKKWNQPENVPDCLLLHLETFMWTGYDEFLVEEEKQVAKYIIRNTNLLERATFSSILMSSEDKLELKSVVRAAHSCQLLFK